MEISNAIKEGLDKLIHQAAMERVDENLYRDICRRLRVCKMYYEMDLGGDDRYRNHRTGKLVLGTKEIDRKLILYDSGEEGSFARKYTYY